MERSKRRRDWKRIKSSSQGIWEYLGIGVLALLAVCLCFCDKGYAVQPNGLRRVGMLFNVPELKNELLNGLAEHGWINGYNFIMEGRYAVGREGRLLALAKELVDNKPDVIVASSSPAARAAMAATAVIPIIAVGDPVGDKLVTNPLQPEANVTGLISTEPPEVSGKRVELLKQAFPSITRVAVLVPSWIPSRMQNLQHTEYTARQLRINIQPIMLERRPDSIQNACSKLTNLQALLILPWVMEMRQKSDILHCAATMRFPVFHTRRGFAARGGFMSYGPVQTYTWKRIASFVDKAFRGGSPAEIPVERPLRFELVINLKTADNFGFTVAPELLPQADEVIR